VLSVDVPRHRISLTLRLDEEAPPPAPRPAGGRDRADDRPSDRSGRTGRGASGRPGPRGASRAPEGEGALAEALRRAGLVPNTPKRPPTGSIG
jgi:uncharacterized protein